MSELPKLWCDFSPQTNFIRSEIERFRSPDIAIWPEDSEGVPNWFSWSSWHLDDANSLEELIDRTLALKAVFDGAFFLKFGSGYSVLRFMPPPGGGGLPVDQMHRGDVRAEPFSAIHMKRKVGTILQPISDISYLIFLARFDEAAKQVLKFLGVNGISYLSLYALIDWMGQDWSDERIANEAGISKAFFRAFKHTANSPAYLGPLSRHGGIDTPPMRPVNLEDAEGPILTAMNAFLSERAKLIALSQKWRAIEAL